MKTWYLSSRENDGTRAHWQRPTAYRPYIGREENPCSQVLYLGWLVLEWEWYACAMTARGVVNRPKQPVTVI